jgi:16S rRNA (guanine966-N2)-methyltransferase
MRILAGHFKGKILAAPAGMTTRPSSVRLRQALFDMLMHAPWAGRAAVENASVLDGFAGTGALGLEALSRGAAHGCFVEQDRAALHILKRNIAACGVAPNAEILAGDFLTLNLRGPFDLIFLDPPYEKNLIDRALNIILAKKLAAPGALIVAESSSSENINFPGEILAARAHGAGVLRFLRAASVTADPGL